MKILLKGHYLLSRCFVDATGASHRSSNAALIRSIAASIPGSPGAF
jgi:hypothetical protein